MTTAVVAKSPTTLAGDLNQALTDAGSDLKAVETKVAALFTTAETSAPVTAVKSFVGSVLKSGRGGASLALLAAAPAAFFLGPMAGLYMVAVVAVLIATSPAAVSMLTGSTKGEPGWAILLGMVVAAAAGAGLLWALNNGALAILTKLL